MYFDMCVHLSNEVSHSRTFANFIGCTIDDEMKECSEFTHGGTESTSFATTTIEIAKRQPIRPWWRRK